MRKLLLVMLLLCLPLAAQVPDPPFDQPGAQENAEMRFALNWLFLDGGYMLPPVGWNCVPLLVWIGDVPTLAAHCEPDPVLVDEQQREADEWLRELARGSLELFPRERRNSPTSRYRRSR